MKVVLWHRLGLLLSVCITAMLLPVLYRQIVFAPNTYLFSASGDGLMMDFQSAWHAKYGSGGYFTGFNYPYKEGLPYAGGQAGWSFLLASLRQLGLDVSAYSLGIINTIVLLLIVFSSFIAYKLLRLLGCNVFWCTLGSLMVTFMAPVIDRVFGHICLGYPFFIPTVLYLAYTFYIKPQQWWRLIVLFVLMTFWGFNNAYFSALGSLFMFTCSCVLLLLQRSKAALHLLLCTVFSLAVLAIIMSKLNASEDRIKYSHGFFTYSTTPLGLAMPHYQPANHIWKDKLRLPLLPTDEANVYIGFTTCILLLVGLFVFYRRPKDWLLLKCKNPFWLAAFLSSGFFFLLACNFIFGLNEEFFQQKLHLIYKYRASSRLAWIFATVLIIIAVIAANRLTQLKNKTLSYLVTALIALPLIVDAYVTVKHKVYNVYWISEQNYLSTQNLSRLVWPAGTNYKPQDFQSITVMPLLCMWSDKHEFAPFKQDQVTRPAMQLSLKYGLPFNSALLSRIAYKHTLQHGQLLAHEALPRDVFSDLPNKKPFLFVVGADSLLRAEEKDFLKKSCTYLGVLNEDARLFAFLPYHNHRAAQDSLLRIPHQAALLTEHFNNTQQPAYVLDGTAISDNQISNYVCKPNTDADSVRLTFWTHTNPLWYGFAKFKVQVIDSKGYYEQELNTNKGYDSYKLWLRSELVVPIYSKQSVIKFYPLLYKHWYMDRLQVSLPHTSVSDTVAGKIWVNNYPCF